MATKIQDGVKIIFKKEYGGLEEGIFTVSQWDEEKQRGWAGDENGCGWYFTADQVELYEADEE